MEKTTYGSFGEYQESRGSTAVTEESVRQFIAGKAGQDETFRKALIADPRGTVEAEIGIQMPGVELKVHEETNDELHLVLPASMELTPSELARVSGGWPGTGGGGNDDDTPIDFDDNDPG